MNTKKSTLLLVLLISIVLSACGGGGGGGGGNQSGNTTKDGVQTLSYDQGGTVSIGDQSSPIRGTKVLVKPNTLGADTETISIEYQDALPGPFSAQAQSFGVAQASKTLILKRGTDVDLELPAEVTLPYDKSVVADNEVPVVLFWDETLARYSPVSLISVDRSAGTVTFRTAHFSSYVVAILKAIADKLNVSQPSVDTIFRPSTDDFFVHNFGAYDYPGGSCLGMANYSAWYFDAKKPSKGAGLQTLYKEGIQAAEEDDQNVRELISRTFIASEQYWAHEALRVQAAEGEVFTGMYLIQSMIITGSPQVLLMADSVPLTINGFGHATTVYRYDADNLRFEVYDNNFPRETVFLEWNPLTGFGNYSKYNGKVQEFAFDALHSTFSPATFEKFFNGVESGWDSSKFAKISITQPTASSKDPNLYEVSGDTNVVIGGQVPRLGNETNPNAQRYAHIYLNGVTKAGVANVDQSGNFTFTIPTLPSATGTEMMILVSEHQKAWQRGFRAFKQIKIRSSGVSFFVNLGFETGAFDPWVNERHLWRGGDQVIPSDKSEITIAGFDPIATDLPTVRFGGFATRINNSDPNLHISTLTQSAVVPNASNPTLRFSWAAVLEDPQHQPDEQPYVEVSVVNQTKGTTLFSRRYFSNDPTYSGWQSYLGGQWKGIPWQVEEVNVASHIGDSLVLKVEAADCSLGGHGGYAYLDAEE